VRIALVLLWRAEKPARELAELVSLRSVPPLVAECQGEVTQGETVSLSAGGVPFSPARRPTACPLAVQHTFTPNTPNRNWERFLQERIPQQNI